MHYIQSIASEIPHPTFHIPHPTFQMKQAAILTIYGRVQGVGFRYFVKQKADMIGISGYVKNQPKGIVYAEAEGEPELLELFIKECHRGPSHAWVEKIDIQYCPPQDMEGFHIR